MGDAARQTDWQTSFCSATAAAVRGVEHSHCSNFLGMLRVCSWNCSARLAVAQEAWAHAVLGIERVGAAAHCDGAIFPSRCVAGVARRALLHGGRCATG